MATTKMASVLQRDIAEELGFRLPALTLVQTTGTSGDPVITLGALTAASQSAFIRIVPEATLQLNSVGLAAPVYTPHIVQVVLETSTIANVALMLESNKFPLFHALQATGCKVELYMSANTNAVDEADITSGNLKATLYPALNFPLSAQT
jgi:hypothetical protein